MAPLQTACPRCSGFTSTVKVDGASGARVLSRRINLEVTRQPWSSWDLRRRDALPIDCLSNAATGGSARSPSIGLRPPKHGTPGPARPGSRTRGHTAVPAGGRHVDDGASVSPGPYNEAVSNITRHEGESHTSLRFNPATILLQVSSESGAMALPMARRHPERKLFRAGLRADCRRRRSGPPWMMEARAGIEPTYGDLQSTDGEGAEGQRRAGFVSDQELGREGRAGLGWCGRRRSRRNSPDIPLMDIRERRGWGPDNTSPRSPGLC